MLTILEQYERKCEEGGGDVICPTCHIEIGEYDDWVVASRYIESNRCPICDCAEDDWDCTHKWCVHCKNWCEARKEQAEYERHVENEWRSEYKYK